MSGYRCGNRQQWRQWPLMRAVAHCEWCMAIIIVDRSLGKLVTGHPSWPRLLDKSTLTAGGHRVCFLRLSFNLQDVGICPVADPWGVGTPQTALVTKQNFWASNHTKSQQRPGLRPGPHWGSLQRSPIPQAGGREAACLSQEPPTPASVVRASSFGPSPSGLAFPLAP